MDAAQPGNEQVRSVNAVIGETNDGRLNDIRARRVTKADGLAAIAAAREGAVPEGAVGAGPAPWRSAGKGGIGTSSRRLPAALGGWTVGVLVQSNYGGQLTVAGVPVQQALEKNRTSPDGSVIVVIATDAPLSDRNLTRLARRTFLGIARTGSAISNGSGDYASLSRPTKTRAAHRRAAARRRATPNCRTRRCRRSSSPRSKQPKRQVLNSMFKATMTEANGARVEALPVARVVKLYRQARRER
jgi:D-aminopeptidase